VGTHRPLSLPQNWAMENAVAHVPSTVSELGAPIGLGRTAEVFALGDSDVVKLLRPGFLEKLVEEEATVAARVDAAGVAAPHFKGRTRIEGRPGVVFQRVAGPSMLDLLGRRPLEIDRLARRFAELHAAMHDAAGAGLSDQKASLRWAMDYAAPNLPAGSQAAALARLDALPGGTALCHGDMHPGNVIMAASGPVVIDWMTARNGNPTADVARTLFLLRDAAVPGHMSRVQSGLLGLMRRRLTAVYLRHYRTLRSIDSAELAAWRLPILAARLAEDIEAEKPGIQAMIRRELASAR
jgi:aminoglycoside phosphotransferase (APT) family kinase protein